MTAKYVKADSNPIDVQEDPEHDSLYSNPERQREHLHAKGYSDEEIEEFMESKGIDEAETSPCRTRDDTDDENSRRTSGNEVGGKKETNSSNDGGSTRLRDF